MREEMRESVCNAHGSSRAENFYAKISSDFTFYVVAFYAEKRQYVRARCEGAGLAVGEL